jgi:hypothetical protein
MIPEQVTTTDNLVGYWNSGLFNPRPAIASKFSAPFIIEVEFFVNSLVIAQGVPSDRSTKYHNIFM